MKVEEIDCEAALIGCALTEPGLLVEAAKVKPEHFATKLRQSVWAMILEIDQAGGKINSISVAGRLKGGPKLARMLEDIRAPALDGQIHTPSIGWYADKVIDMALGRRIREVIGSLAQRASDPTLSAREELAMALRELEDIDNPPDEGIGGKELLHQLLNKYEDRLAGGVCDQFIPTGLDAIDQEAGGVKRGGVTVIGGRSSGGKSSLANAIIDHACRTGHNVALFGYEDTPLAVAARMVARSGDLSNRDLQRFEVPDRSPARVNQAFAEAAVYLDRLRVYHEMPSSMAELSLQIRRDVEARQTSLVVIDFVQLMDGLSEKKNRYESLGEISKGVFRAARRNNVGVLLLSQLKRAEGRPSKEDLRDCGNIEEDAYGVWLLWDRKLTYGSIDPGSERPSEVMPVRELLLAKNKNGGTPDRLLLFDPRQTTFYNLIAGQLRDDYYKAKEVADAAGTRGGRAGKSSA